MAKVKIKSSRPAAAKFNGMEGEFIRKVEEGVPAYNPKVDQVVVNLEGYGEVHFLADEVVGNSDDMLNRRDPQSTGGTAVGSDTTAVGAANRRPGQSNPNANRNRHLGTPGGEPPSPAANRAGGTEPQPDPNVNPYGGENPLPSGGRNPV